MSTVRINKPAINLREALAKLTGLKPETDRYTFWFSGDSSTTDFEVEEGWKPVEVFSDGSIQRPGSGEDYEITFDGFLYTVSFAVAPAAVDIAVQAERKQ